MWRCPLAFRSLLCAGKAEMKIPMPEIVRRFVVFTGVGALNTAIGLGLILFLSEVLRLHYMLANGIGYLLGFAIVFFMHRTITFRDVSHMNKMGAQFRSFFAIFMAGYAVQ